MADFRELLSDGRPHLFDGAMGTMLYARGVYINRCYDELNLRQPELVSEIHREYVRAGAEILETNSYGANRIKLSQFGLQDEVHEINRRAAELARSVANPRVCIGGAIGPLGGRIEPYGAMSLDEAFAVFREQAEGLLAGGVDLFILETFSDLVEVQQALRAVREVADLPVVAQMVIREDGHTPFGTDAAVVAERLTAWGADVVGMNCSVGPQSMLETVDGLLGATDRPVSCQPNAGLPREVDGRTMYMASPEYMAEYAGRLVRKGVRFVGGCCGTTPEHIRMMAGVVRAAAPGRVRVSGSSGPGSTGISSSGPGLSGSISSPGAPSLTGSASGDSSTASPGGGVVVTELPEKAAASVAAVPLAERSAWGSRLARGEFLTTVEIVPPRGVDPVSMLEGVELLRAAGINGVNVPDGPRAQSRMGVLATSLLIQQKVGMEAVTHYCCRDRNLLGMLSDLLGAQALGLRNLLLITGDPPKMGPYPDATAVFDIDSIGLTNLVAGLNRGIDPGGNPIGAPTSFVIGVGANPGAIDLDDEIRRFYWKVEAGAEYAITQPVFDSRQFYTFLERLEKEGIRIPIIAGIWPLVSARNAEFLANEVPGVIVPPEVLKRMRSANERGKDFAIAEGIAIAREMLGEALPAIQGVQVSAPFGRVPLALEVFEALPGWSREQVPSVVEG